MFQPDEEKNGDDSEEKSDDGDTPTDGAPAAA